MSVMNMLPGGSTMQIPLDAPTSFSATAGNAQVELTWTDPLDKYATPEGEVSDTGDQLVSEWDHTVLVRKTGSQPAGSNDGTVVVSSSVRNQYQSTAYVDSGLTNDTTYYYGVFAYNKDGVASPGAFTTATPKAGTPISSLSEGTLIKINENGSPVEFYLVKHNYEPTLNGEGRELVVRKDVHSDGVWNTSDTNRYATSYIDAWFNSTYKSLFSAIVQQMMATTVFYYIPFGRSDTRESLSRAVFTCSQTEVGRGDGRQDGSTLPIAAQLNTLAAWWWLRTPSTGSSGARLNGPTNEITQGCDESGGYRPCFTLPSTAVVNDNLELVED